MSELVILGAGGHARVLLSALRSSGHKVVGCVSAEAPDSTWPNDIAYFGPDTALQSLDRARFNLVSGIGGVGSNEKRRLVFTRAKAAGFVFHSVIHPRAFVAEDVQIGEGAVIMMGAIVQVGCVLEPNVIINTGAIVDHDSRIGAHVHIAPGAALSGGVTIAEGAHIGTGASVIQGVSIGRNAILGAGSVAIGEIPDHGVFLGVPARSVMRAEGGENKRAENVSEKALWTGSDTVL